MKQMAMNAASKAGGAAGTLKAASQMDGGGAGKPGMVMSMLQGAKAGVAAGGGGVGAALTGGLIGGARGIARGAKNSAGTVGNLATLAYRQNPVSKGYQAAMSGVSNQIGEFNQNATGARLKDQNFGKTTSQSSSTRKFSRKIPASQIPPKRK